jgi:hypothetical protein
MAEAASEPRKRPHWAARAAAALAAALGVASCTSVLSLESYQNAPDAICELLEGCYAESKPLDCRTHVNSAIDGAAWSDVSDWFRSVSANGCLDTCTSARRCMDSSPICLKDARAACTDPEDCCGYTTGAADCQGGQCCATLGHHCSDDQDCCDAACDPGTNTCGGTKCHDPGVGCTLDVECCSHNCQRNVCADTICSPEGFDCKDDVECCEGVCTAGKCVVPSCGKALAVCKSDADCCSGAPDNLVCFKPDGAPVGICSTNQCLPEQADCVPGSTSKPCCPGTECDATYFKCGKPCVPDGASCASDAPCCSGACGTDGLCPTSCSTAYCKQDSDCCSHTCIAGTCAPECQSPACKSHSVCVIGEPLDPSPACDSQAACIATICQNDSYCCCTGWDAFCVQEAIKLSKLCSELCQ